MTNAHDQPKASSLDLGPHPDESIARLRWFNLAMGGLHLLQGIAIVALSNNFRAPVTGSFLDGPPGTPTQLIELFSIPFGWGVAAFVFLSAIAHFLIAGPLFGAYSRQLRQGRNDFRWIEYALSASWMIVLIAMLTGASDFAALLGLFGVNAAMILFGLIAERSGQPGGSGWQLPFWGVFLTLGLFLLIYRPTFSLFLTMPLLVRVLVATALIVPPGFFMGMCFPLGILTIKDQPQGAIAWAWGMNGLFTVVGGVLSVLFSIYLGFTVTLVVGLAIYLLAYALFSRLRTVALP